MTRRPRSVGFKKAFRAQPVKLGPYWRAEQAKARRGARLRIAWLIGRAALAVFIIGMVATNWTALTSKIPVFYWNCDSARSHGVAPIQRGEPGYRSGLDADDDGIACEPIPQP